ncbi:DUF4253 domain-containing protein [Nocardia sp. NPDC024068]|uniref:DUF4253 domain-containing protein n=1 Tax=Nocardia sp. NPDC024068 TaxID=3157197 RepID=UPI0034058533
MTDTFTFPTLPRDLPAGRVIRVEDAQGPAGGREVLWVSEHPCTGAGELWSRLYEQRTATGLYPLLLDYLEPDPGPDADGEARPWHSAELAEFRYASVGMIDALDPAEVLRGMWPMADDDEIPGSDAPHDWPGLADSGTAGTDPGAAAGELAYRLDGDEPRLIGLVPAGSGADALTVCGWEGPLNHTNFTEEISVVVRSWEQRFGVRVVMVGFDTLHLSVASPPASDEHARQVAAEHMAFCPDNFDSGTFDAYAKSLIGLGTWNFWWD